MKNTRVIGVVIASMLFGLASAAPAMAIVTVPPDLSVGAQYRLAFVTSTARNASSSDIADYNLFVTMAANRVPELNALGTTWTAIGSTATVDARDNTGTNPSSTGVPIYRLDSNRIANHNADLWNTFIQTAIDIDEHGNPTRQSVWTGTRSDGTRYITRTLGSSSSVTETGLSNRHSSIWVEFFPGARQLQLPLYAISAELTAPIPIPATFYLFGTAIAGLLGVGWRRHSAST